MLNTWAPLFILAPLMIWSAIWKFLALWKSARKNSVGWFIVLAIVNTLGILEILYIYVFSERSKKHKLVKRSRKVRRKRR